MLIKLIQIKKKKSRFNNFLYTWNMFFSDDVTTAKPIRPDY